MGLDGLARLSALAHLELLGMPHLPPELLPALEGLPLLASLRLGFCDSARHILFRAPGGAFLALKSLGLDGPRSIYSPHTFPPSQYR